MPHYAYKTDYEDYTETDTADLPSEIQRKLDQAEAVIDQMIKGNGQPEVVDLDSDYSSTEKTVSILEADVFTVGDKVALENDDNENSDTIADIESDLSGSDIITLESSLANDFAVSDRSRIKTVNPDDHRLRERHALTKAVCAQIEYWEVVGDELGILSEVEDISISKFSISGKSGLGRLAPKAKTELNKIGLLYAGRNTR